MFFPALFFFLKSSPQSKIGSPLFFHTAVNKNFAFYPHSFWTKLLAFCAVFIYNVWKKKRVFFSCPQINNPYY